MDMASLGLLVVVATGLVAFHVAIALYLYRVAATSNDGSTASELDRADLDSEAHRRGDGAANPQVRCGICGTRNDPTYHFCRQCIADLSGSAPTTDGPDWTERLGS